MIKKSGLSLAMAIAISLGSVVCVEAAGQVVNVVVNGSAVTNEIATNKSQAVTQWGNTNDSEIEVIGLGLPNGLGARGAVLAKRAAIVDAYRNLAEATQGVQVDSETTVEQLMVQNDTIHTKVSAMIKGARVIAEGVNPDGSYYVKMKMPMYGSNSLAAAVLPSIVPAVAEPLPVPGNAYTGPVASSAFTGVIIDARGLGLTPTFSPALYDENGRGIYGVRNVDADYAINYGMVEYAKDDNMAATAAAGNSRAGNNPLIIKATAAKLSVNGVTKVNAVISAADADRILRENERAGFLGKCAVVFEI